MGEYAAGTILIAGTSTPRNLSHSYIDLYASQDSGNTWKFVSHIAYGAGPETVQNGDKAIWEPFLMLYKNQLVCFYSDQRDPNHAQKLVHTTTQDLKTWTAPIDDVAEEDYSQRPGMATVAYSPVSGKYVMTFEFCGGPLASGCPAYFKTASSPLEFGAVDPFPITPNDPDLNPNGSPYITYSAVSGKNNSGVFIMNGNSQESVFVNTDAVDPNGWKAVDVGQWSAYSRSLRVINTPPSSAAAGITKLLILNGGNIGCSGSCYNYVASAVVDIPQYPTS